MSGPEASAPFAEYFRLQLLLAETVAARTGAPLAETVTRHTNLARRLGLEEPAAWAAYTAELADLPDTEARLAVTMARYAAAVAPSFSNPRFGCFAHETPDAAGVVRLHFPGGDAEDGTGPLARHKVGRRRAELAAMTASVRERFPGATAIRGGSWLYNLEAYRRLFPPAFAASRTSPGTWQLGGTSTWGQLIDHAGQVRPEARDHFLARLPTLDPARPWEAFQLRALVTRAPIEAFTEFYRDVDVASS